MDAVGYLTEHGVSGLNALLLVSLFFVIRNKVADLDAQVKKLWEWHLIQKGKELAKHHHQEEDV